MWGRREAGGEDRVGISNSEVRTPPPHQLLYLTELHAGHDPKHGDAKSVSNEQKYGNSLLKQSRDTDRKTMGV